MLTFTSRGWERCKGLIVLGLLLTLLAACGVQEDQAVPGQYPEDGYLGMTQTNPNLPTNPTARNYAADNDAVRRTLENIKGVQLAQIISNGSNVWVYLTVNDGLSDAERENIRQQAVKALSFNNPRFNYRVIVR
jgi:outer membrane lipoprotein-sorting protein